MLHPTLMMLITTCAGQIMTSTRLTISITIATVFRIVIIVMIAIVRRQVAIVDRNIPLIK